MSSQFCLNRMMGASCILSACFLQASCKLPASFLHASYMLLACFLHASLPASCVLPTCFLHASCMLPECFLLYCCYMLQYTKITTSKLNWTETHTILSTFLGSTQEAHVGASCVLPSVASLTGRSVYPWLVVHKFG